MKGSPREALPVLLVAAVILSTSLSLYIGAYFWLSDTIMSVDRRQVIRAYRSQAIAAFFRPAALMETCIAGRSVSTVCPLR